MYTPYKNAPYKEPYEETYAESYITTKNYTLLQRIDEISSRCARVRPRMQLIALCHVTMAKHVNGTIDLT